MSSNQLGSLGNPAQTIVNIPMHRLLDPSGYLRELQRVLTAEERAAIAAAAGPIDEKIAAFDTDLKSVSHEHLHAEKRRTSAEYHKNPTTENLAAMRAAEETYRDCMSWKMATTKSAISKCRNQFLKTETCPIVRKLAAPVVELLKHDVWAFTESEKNQAHYYGLKFHPSHFLGCLTFSASQVTKRVEGLCAEGYSISAFLATFGLRVNSDATDFEVIPEAVKPYVPRPEAIAA